MMEKEIILIGYSKEEEGICIEGFCKKGEYNINMAKKFLEKYDNHIEIDITDLLPEEIFKDSETIKERHMYTSIFTTGNNNAKISTIKTIHPLKHVLFSLLTPGNHVILYGGKINIEINISSSDYYYGDGAVITSSEVTSVTYCN